MPIFHTLRAWTARTARLLFGQRRIATRAGLALVVIALWAGAATAQEVYTVTSANDSGDATANGTLSWAIAQANANAVAHPSDTNTINFSLVSGNTVTLGVPLIPIDANVTINGAGTPGLTIDGGGTKAAFFVDIGTVKIENLTIANTNSVGGAGALGGAGGGGGLGAGGAVFVNETATVTIQNVAFQNNAATGGAGGVGSPGNHEGGGGGGGFHGAGGASQPGGGGGGGFVGNGGAAADGGDGGGGGGGQYGNGGSNGGGVAGGGGGGGTNLHQNGFGGTGGTGGAGGGTSGGTGASAGGPAATAGTTGGGGGGGTTGENAGAGGKFGGGGGGGWGGGPGAGNSGAGGAFGGGGGGGSGAGTGSGAAGGFGGGGGAASDTAGATAGAGGFGAGNGGASGTHLVGFGGGGGSGLGGAVFVRTGGTLIIIDSGISGSSVTAGAGGTGTSGNGANGSADGSAIYAMAGFSTDVEVDSGTQTIAGSIGGAGGLVKTGAGTLTLSGTNDYTGATEVAGGTLNLTGSLTSNTTVDHGAVLSGDGTINGNLTNSGKVGLAGSIEVFNVTGTFNQNANGETQIGINPSAAPVIGTNNSFLAVQNNAGAGSSTVNGAIEVTGANGFYQANNQRYYLLGIQGTPTFNASANLDGVNPSNVTYGSQSVVYGGVTYDAIYMQILNSFVIGQSDFAAYATTPNQLAVANYIDNNSQNTNVAWQSLISTLDSLSPSGVQHALDQMSGALYGSVAQTDLQSTTLELSFLTRRLGNGLSGVNGAPGGLAVNSYGERINPAALASSDSGLTVRGQNAFWPIPRPSGNWSTWGFGYGLGGNASGTPNAAGLNYSLGGTVVGLESLSEHQAIGMYSGFVGSHLGSYLAGQSANVNGGQMGLYLRRDDGLNYYILLGGMGADGYMSRRLMQFGNVNTTATANYGGWQSQAYLERGVTLQGWKGSIQPYAALQYLYVRQNSFTENGAGIMNLNVAGTDANSLRSLVGVRLAGTGWTVNDRAITPVARALWLHEFLGTSTGINAQFAPIGGTNFAVTGTSLGRDWAILGAGLNWNLGGGWQTYANYDAQVNVAQTFHVGSGGFQYTW